MPDALPSTDSMIAVVRLLLLAAVLSFGMGSQARADGVRVDTQVDPCVPLDRERFVYLLGIELGAAPAAGAAVTLTLRCSDSLILVAAQDATTRKVVSRSVDITSVVPSERERLMALTASELVLASLPEVEPYPEPPPPPPPPPPPIPPREQSPPTRLGADVTAATFLSAMAPIFGLSLHLTRPFSQAWDWNLGLQLGRGSLDSTLEGTTQHVAVSATTAALSWAVRYTQTLDVVDLWAGLAGVVGLAYLKGSPIGRLESTPAVGPWAGPALQLAAAFRAGSRARILLQVEAGLLLIGSRAIVSAPNASMKEPVVLQLRGGWLGANVGFDYAL